MTFIFIFIFLLTFESPWYDLRGWLGVKSELSIYLRRVAYTTTSQREYHSLCKKGISQPLQREYHSLCKGNITASEKGISQPLQREYHSLCKGNITASEKGISQPLKREYHSLWKGNITASEKGIPQPLKREYHSLCKGYITASAKGISQPLKGEYHGKEYTTAFAYALPHLWRTLFGEHYIYLIFVLYLFHGRTYSCVPCSEQNILFVYPFRSIVL